MVDRKEIASAAGRLRRRLDGLQDHQRSVWFGEGAGLFIAALLPSLGAVMVLDNLVHLPMALRVILLAGLVAIGILLGRRAARLLREPLTAERMAVKVEKRFPQVDNRLINSLLLATEDDVEASELIHSVIVDGNADAARLDLRSAVPKRRMAALLGTAGLAMGLMGVYAAAYPDHFFNALARCLVPFASPDPLTRTKIVAVSPKDHNVLAGDDLTVAVELDGALPDTAEVVYTPEEDEQQVALMRPGDAPNRFTCLMADVGKSFSYRVAAGDAESASYRITVHQRPVVASLDVQVAPPAYTGGTAIRQTSGTVRALAGSAVTVRATCSKPIAKAALVLSGSQAPIPMAVEGETLVAGSFQVSGEGTYRIDLTDTFGFASKPAEHVVELLADDPPEIQVAAPRPPVAVKLEDSIPFQFTVTDFYGVQNAEIVQITKSDDGADHEKVLKAWTVAGKTQKTLSVSHEVPVSALGIAPGASGTLAVVARDWNDVTGPGVTRSEPPIVVTVLSSQEVKDKSREALRLAAMELAQIVEKQRRNLAAGRALRTDEIREPGSLAKTPDKLADSVRLQEDIHTSTGKLIELMDEKLPMRGVVRLLYEGEMVAAVKQLRAVAAAPKPVDAFATALETESTILTRLTGRNEQLRRVVEDAGLRDLFAALEAIVREQKAVREQTDAASQGGGAEPNKPLADRQDKLAMKVVAFKDQVTDYGRAVAQSDPEQGKRYDAAAAMIDTRQIRPNMLLSAAKLDKGQLSQALPVQDKILADLKAIADFLREPVVASATRKLEELRETVADAKDKTDRLAKLQAAVKEVSEELERSKDNTTEGDKDVAKKAHELEDVKSKLEDVTEKMAKDLSLFPEVPSCNELVQQMREVFEDVEQQPGSESQAADEIAVDRDEGMLDALDKVKERLADMEEWLTDKPDTTKWKQEGWDKGEMPQIPLVDLPEEMEDLVGDLVDKEEDVDDQAQDSSSNAGTADIPAGWDVVDGPISNWGAKGKSGNEKPNANEMSGRSGGGREGQANGEIVEGKAKDLEGRPTEARRTNDPFSDGYVEEENPDGQHQKARATGGGKMSGTGGEGGMRGTGAARNELGMRDLERRQRELRRNTESIYSKACLMYLPTGELDQAVLLMLKAEEQAGTGDIAGFRETQRRIVHSLQNTQRLLAGKGTVEMDPRQKLPMDIKEELFDARDEPIPPEFEKLVSDYYKAIAVGALK